MILFYQKYISPIYHLLGRALFGESFGCRFTPTCSEYFKLAVYKHGIIQGSVLGAGRYLRCNPLFKGGLDQVPDKIK
jgi:uncharacterized protein